MARALYIHWPFCLKKCPYCDFYSHVRDAGSIDAAQWRAALLADMAHEAQTTAHETLTSIFFGGGTPSLMPPSLVAALLDAAESHWGFAPDIEITLEANPSSVEAAHFAALAHAGINRVSLGVQSLDDAALAFLGRLHSAREALHALATAQRHFARVNIDLIYARPGQTPAQWAAELTAALALGTGHLSLYQLTIEDGTRFATDVRTGAFMPLADDPAADLFALTGALTAAAGLPPYEVSNHARAGEQSRHNLAYWRYQDYVGIGPGAHGRRGDPDGQRTATVRHKKPENFLSGIARHGNGIAESRALDAAEQATEAMLMGLRLAEGVDITALAARFGLPPDRLANPAKITRYASLGLVEPSGTRLTVTPEGMPVLNALLAEIVADPIPDSRPQPAA